MTPSDTKIPAILTISSEERRSGEGVSGAPSSGMQYWHRRLHLRTTVTRSKQVSGPPHLSEMEIRR